MTQPKRKLPKAILRELERIKGDRVVAATVLTITDEQIADYQALGLLLSGGKVLTGDPAPPPPSGGLYARRNIEGWNHKRTDLPKEQRTISHLAPSWNNGGFHLVSREVEAYPGATSRVRPCRTTARCIRPWRCQVVTDGPSQRASVTGPYGCANGRARPRGGAWGNLIGRSNMRLHRSVPAGGLGTGNGHSCLDSPVPYLRTRSVAS